MPDGQQHRLRDVSDPAGWNALVTDGPRLDVLVNNAGHHPRLSADRGDAHAMERAVRGQRHRHASRHAGRRSRRCGRSAPPRSSTWRASSASPVRMATSPTGEQGGHHRHDEDCGTRARRGRDPRQRDLPRWCLDAHERERARGRCRPAHSARPPSARQRDLRRHRLLASDDASFITGTELVIDGGHLAR
jgi:hypothetical protein